MQMVLLEITGMAKLSCEKDIGGCGGCGEKSYIHHIISKPPRIFITCNLLELKADFILIFEVQ